MKRSFFLLFALVIFVSCSSDKVFESALSGRRAVLVFEDDFNRGELGANYEVQGGDWKIENGKVRSRSAKNRNLVLKGHALPQDALIELTMRSDSDAVDVKFNLWGDGKIHDHGDGYSFILGGWKNRISVISKLDEHEKKRSEKRDAGLSKGVEYKCKVVRISNKISWFVNDKLFLTYDDKEPLEAEKGYDRLSFANWRSDVTFDDLKIYRLEEK